MIVAATRWAAFFVMLFCLVASSYRQAFDGVSLIGLCAAVVFFLTFPGLFERSTWIADEATSDELAMVDAALDSEERAA